MDNPQQETQAVRRAKISYACEACRASKVKCQPSTEAGICKRYVRFWPPFPPHQDAKYSYLPSLEMLRLKTRVHL
jgi:hypothetical protein